MTHRRALLFLLLLTSSATLLADDARIKRPTEIVYEVVIGYGRDPQRAEADALTRAAQAARLGKYDLKSISIAGGSDGFYCLAGIQYKIYKQEDKVKAQEVTVGYGSDWQRAEHHARSKAATIASSKQSSGTSTNINGTKARSANNNLRLLSVRFSKIGKEILCCWRQKTGNFRISGWLDSQFRKIPEL